MRFFFSCFFLFLILIGFVYADIQIIPVKSELNPGETLQARVIVSDMRLLRDLSVSDFALLDSSGNKILVSQSLIKTGANEYYTYLDMPMKKNSNYSFGVKDVQYFALGNELKKSSFYTALSTNSENVSIAVSPAYVSLLNIESYDQPTLSFFIRNKGFPTTVVISSPDAFLVPTITRFDLNSGEQKQIEVKTKVVGKIQDVFSGNVVIKYGGFEYRIPVLITRKGFVRINVATNESKMNEEVNETTAPIIPSEEKNYGVEYGSLVLSSPTITEIRYVSKDALKQNDFIRGDMTFSNAGNTTLRGIVVSYKGLEDILIVNKQRFDLDAGSDITLSIALNASLAKAEKYKGELFLIAENGVNFSLPFEVDIQIEQKKTEIPNVTKTPAPNFSALNQTPKEKDGSSFISWFLIIAVIGVLIVVISYLYNKGKPKQQAYENLVESFKQRR